MSELTIEQLRMPVGLKVGGYEMTNCCGGKIKEPKNCSVCGRELVEVYGLKDEIEFRSKGFSSHKLMGQYARGREGRECT